MLIEQFGVEALILSLSYLATCFVCYEKLTANVSKHSYLAS